MKKVFLLVVAISLALWLTGCASGRSLNGFKGGGGGSSSFQTGNWALNGTGGASGAVFFGGNLSENNSTVTGNLFAAGAGGCFKIGPGVAPMAVSGTISGTALTLSGTLTSGQTVSFALTLPTGTITTMTGTYSITGGTCATGDHGSIAADIAGSVTGTWSGTSDVSSGIFSAAITEASTASSSGSFPITGTGTSPITFSGVTGCTVFGTFNSSNDSFAAGSLVFLDMTTTDNGLPGNLLMLGVINNDTNPTTMSTEYLYSGGSGCFFNNSNNGNGTGSGVITLNKS